MDRAILDQFDYGLYLASATAGGKQFGCIVNSLSQVTSASPEKFSLALNQSSATKKAIDQARCAVHHADRRILSGCHPQRIWL